MQVGLVHLLIVGLGGALGGIVRFWLSSTVNRWLGGAFPWGTLVVNVSGSFAIGLLAASLPKASTGSTLWLALAVGILGSYTTVSSFSLETLTLLRNGQPLQAGLNVAVSLGLCLGAATLGYVSGHGGFGA
jgi:fluoride exporter